MPLKPRNLLFPTVSFPGGLNTEDRLAIQAKRHSPPAVLQDALVKKARAALERERTVPPPAGRMSKALGRAIARLEIHMMLKGDRIPVGKLTADDDKHIAVMSNPTEVIHTIKVKRADMATPGRAGNRRHYTGTENAQITFSSVWDAFVGGGDDGKTFDHNIARVIHARRFLQSLTLPSGEAGTIDEGAPPRMLFFWTNYCSLTCDVDSVTFKDDQFMDDGRLRGFEASFDLREIGDLQLSREGVLADGLFRAKNQEGAASGDQSTSGESGTAIG